MRGHGHVQCDTPNCGAIHPESSPKLESWSITTADDGAEVAYCGMCVERAGVRLIGGPLGLICPRCGATPDDDVFAWINVRDDAGGWITVCDKCHRDDDVGVVI